MSRDHQHGRVLTFNFDALFEAAVDALVHTPFGVSTFGQDITSQFESHFPVTMRQWEALQHRHQEHVFSSPVSNGSARRTVIHLPLLKDYEDQPSLQSVFNCIEELVAEVRRKQLTSIAIYGLTIQGLHGSTFAGYLSAAFHQMPVVVHLYDQPLPQLL